MREQSRLLGEQLGAVGLELRPPLREQLGVDGADGAAEEGRGGDQLRTGRLGVAELRGRLSQQFREDRKSTRLNSSHVAISYAVFCLKKKKPAHTRCHCPNAAHLLRFQKA